MTIDITSGLSATPDHFGPEAQSIEFEFAVFSQQPIAIAVEYRLDQTNSVWFEAAQGRTKHVEQTQALTAGASAVRQSLRLERLPEAAGSLFAVFVTATVTEVTSRSHVGATVCLIRLDE